MENILVVLPENWNIKRVRYVQHGTEVKVTNLDVEPTPLESTESLYDYGVKVVKPLGRFDPEYCNICESMKPCGLTHIVGKCGAWPEKGGCILPSRHNMGRADIPDNHQFD